ncbi:MAG: dihydrolipoyl dehydrogenase [Armatimonadetes bacterium]|nr:dihydrolipoyl dehydrogenase [Armatimonadota bacterium]
MDSTNPTPQNAASRLGKMALPDINSAAALFANMTIPGVADASNLVHPGIKEQLNRSSEFDADICIIGSGPGGYVAAIRAAQLGARVVIVEKGSIGGTCLNIGCIPTKVLLSSVAVLDHIKHSATFGVKVEKFELDIQTMQDRKGKIVKQLTSGVEGLLRKNKVKLVRGFGRLTGAHEVTVDTEKGTEAIKADKIIIATGSVPAKLPLPGFEIGENVWTSNEALEFKKVPKKILIIGAGAIGLEFGYTFARMGAEVLIVEMMPQILPAADTETANLLQKSLEAAGIKIMTNASVTRAEDIKGGKKAYVKSGDKETAMEFDKILVAVGRRTVIDGIGLDEVGVKHEKHKITVNEHMQTNVPSIYAIGDVIGEPMLAHVGWTEGIVAVEHGLGMGGQMSYKAFPACVYTTPECASVGLTEEQARERYKDIRVGKFGFGHNGKAMGIGETEGFVKFISEPRYGEILGVHIVGPHATDLIAEAVLAMRNELTIDEVVAAIHPHPTLSEVVQEAAYDTQGRAIHK